MKATATTKPTAPQVSAADVVKSIGRCAALCLIYVLQTIAKALDLAQRAALSVRLWLSRGNNFAYEVYEGDPIILDEDGDIAETKDCVYRTKQYYC